MNTLGALRGVLLVGFVLLPVLGMARSTWTACAINLAIGAGAILLGFTTQEGAPGAREFQDAPPAVTYDRSLRRAALVGIGLSGMAALALEVVWMRILVQSFCATVYAFAIMLSCFLFGIFYGSRWISRRVDAQLWPPHTFALLELGLGFSVVSLAALTYFVPAFFGRLLFHWMHVAPAHFAAAYVVAQFIVSACLILVPALLLGATFPVAVKIYTRSDAGVGHGVGAVYAANTIGAVAGALLGGMVLIPAVGTRNSLIVIGAIFAAVGIYLLLLDGGDGWTRLRGPALALVMLFAVSAAVGLAMPHQIVTNLYHYIMWSHPQVIYHGEGVAHNVDIFRSGGITTMTINGGGEADTSYAARRQFILKAHLPLLLHPDPKDVAVVGLGLGITLSATNRNPNVQHIEVIELTREMVTAQRYLEDVSGGVLHSPKVHVRIDDGRNFMAMTDRSFDMITADPIHPRNTGVGYLYTREYYESIKRRLRPQGVVCQWMPLYEMSKPSFAVAFRTFVSVFPNTSLWVVGANGLFVATVEPFRIDYHQLTERMQDPAVKADLDSIGVHSAPELLALMWMGPAEIARYVAANPGSGLNTDDNGYLEYHTPFDLAQRWHGLAPRLLPYAALDLRDVSNLSPQDAEEVTQAWKRQKETVAGELGFEALASATTLAR